MRKRKILDEGEDSCPTCTSILTCFGWSSFGTILQAQADFFSLLIALVVPVACIGLAYFNYQMPNSFMHNVVLTKFDKYETELSDSQYCPLTASKIEMQGPDSICTCLENLDKSQYGTPQKCKEIYGALQAYTLRYAGLVSGEFYVLSAVTLIALSCLTSLTRMKYYPNHTQFISSFVPLGCCVVHITLLYLCGIVWQSDFNSFESSSHREARLSDTWTFQTVRFIYAFQIFGFFLNIPHWLEKVPYLKPWAYPSILLDLNTKGKNAIEGKKKGGYDDEYRLVLHRHVLNVRDEYFRVGYWQSVSEDIQFTNGCMLFVVAFSAHAGVHDDCTLFTDMSCVFMVGLLQHMSHVLMLVKEYIFQDSDDFIINEQQDIKAQQEQERSMCNYIGTTRLMIHGIVFSVFVFFCNRTAPSTFNDNHDTSLYMVARFAVVLVMWLSNTCYDIFFELVHVIKHFSDVAPGFDGNVYDQDNEQTENFLDYHAQYRGPYLWRVMLVLPLLAVFCVFVNVMQTYQMNVTMTDTPQTLT